MESTESVIREPEFVDMNDMDDFENIQYEQGAIKALDFDGNPLEVSRGNLLYVN